jgi:hypothetical protein
LIEPSWVANIGEQARQISIHYNIYLQNNDIIVLGESSMFIVSEHGGKVRYQRRYTFSPSCFISYHLPRRGADLFVEPKQSVEQVIESLESFGKPGKALVGGSAARPGFMTMIGSFEGYLMIYKDI